jgi:HK97 family phage portal protein
VARILTRIKNAFSALWKPLGTGSGQLYSYGRKWDREAPTVVDLLNSAEDTVYACVGIISSNVAKHLSQDLKLCAAMPDGRNPGYKSRKLKITKATKKYGRKGELRELLEHPALRLMEKPNDSMSWLRLIQTTQYILDLAGTAYWEKSRDKNTGKMVAATLLPTQNVQVVLDEDGYIKCYKNGFGANAKEIEPKDMIVFSAVNPFDPYSPAGISPVAAVWQQLLLMKEETDTWRAILQNAAYPSALVTPPEGETWSPVNAERVSKKIQQLFSKKEQGGAAVFNDPINWTPISRPPRDLSALQLHDQITTSIYRVFHVPRPILDPQDSNLASSVTAKRTFQEFCLEPRCNAIVETLNRDFLSEYSEKLFFVVEDIVEKDTELELRERQQDLQEDIADLQNNVITVNERRAKLDLPPVPWGNKPANQQPASFLPLEPDNQPQQDSPRQEEPAPKGDKRTKRVVHKSQGNREELLLAKELREIFALMQEFYLTQVELPSGKNIQGIDVKAFVAADDWEGEIVDRLSPVLQVIYERSGQRMLNALGVNMVLPIPKLKEAVEQAALAFAKSTMETTSKAVDEAIAKTRDELGQGLGEGEGHNQLIGRIKSIFEGMQTERAEAIAWTESSRARHTGELIAAKETGLNVEKKWLAGSPNVCDHCKAFNGQTRPLDQPFAVVGEGPYGTIDCPPAHPRCFCTLQYVTD